MHPSETLDWKAVLAEIDASAYTGPLPSIPCWIGDSESSELLNQLILDGAKTATATLLWDYEFENETLPIVGEVQALLGWSNQLLGLIETSAIDIIPFQEVSAEYAALEGEGDLSLDYWRRVHMEVFTTVCRTIGKTASQDMPVVCEEFRLVCRFG